MLGMWPMCRDLGPANVEGEHVRNVEHACVAARPVVFLDLGAVVQRHLPAAEVDHPGTESAVGCGERRLSEHVSPQ